MPPETPRVAVVSAAGSPFDRRAVEALQEQVERAREQGAERVVIEASAVAEPRYDGLAALLSWAQDAAASGEAGRLVLAAPSRVLLLAVCQTRMQRELDVYGSPTAALRELGGD